MSRVSAGDYQADKQAGVALLRCRVSGRLEDRCRVTQLAIIRQMSRQVSHSSMASIRQMSRHVSHSSADDFQADEQAGVAGLAGYYQADEQAAVARVSWRVSGS